MVRLVTVFEARDRLSPDFAAEVSNHASKFSASVALKYGDKTVRLESLIGILSLELRRGAIVSVISQGVDELAAAEDICRLLMG